MHHKFKLISSVYLNMKLTKKVNEKNDYSLFSPVNCYMNTHTQTKKNEDYFFQNCGWILLVFGTWPTILCSSIIWERSVLLLLSRIFCRLLSSEFSCIEFCNFNSKAYTYSFFLLRLSWAHILFFIFRRHFFKQLSSALERGKRVGTGYPSWINVCFSSSEIE